MAESTEHVEYNLLESPFVSTTTISSLNSIQFEMDIDEYATDPEEEKEEDIVEQQVKMHGFPLEFRNTGDESPGKSVSRASTASIGGEHPEHSCETIARAVVALFLVILIFIACSWWTE
ncbi:hypothetical protein GCK72_025699 [Caenorhabditis remanei]|uniref:Uncharacterized protein n=1 Tax=Caenorhabditis remanei TaxID=31234 RepID=A0A6A5G3F3_CAERE|nr:hypothetical protein GCK72_025699 [Caenorhabditis remanei]KAF1749232.1 hypothetical protein GCK72_025699 [Caenorhabditis remanei]